MALNILTPLAGLSPLIYYHQKGPLGQIFSIFQNKESLPEHVAVIGLGAGASACYQEPNQEWTFYEIDAKVGQLAQDTRYFRYLDECGGPANIVYGDARLSLAAAPKRHYDLLIVDAFSSDAIPIHLMTREALALYGEKLTQQGVLMLHISNHNLDLTSVIGNLAEDAGLMGLDTTIPYRQ